MLGSNTTFNPTGVVWTKNGVETKSVSKLGVGLVRNTSNCQYYPLKTANGGSNDWTIAGIFIPLATFVNAQMPIGVVDTVGTAPNDRSIRASSGSWSGYLYDGTAKIAVSSKAFAVGVPDTIVVSANGTTMTCGVAGVPEVSTGISNNGYTGYSAAKFVLGDASSGTGSTSVAMPIVVRATRAWSYSERQSFLNNPWQIFKPRTFLLGSLTSPQLLYPTGDVAGGTWLPSTGTDLFACIDETAASDADYIYTTVSGAYQEFSFADGGAVDPSTGGHVRYRIPAGTGTITAILKQGSTTLQTLGTHTLTGSAQDIDVTITASTANSTDLRVGFTASA